MTFIFRFREILKAVKFFCGNFGISFAIMSSETVQQLAYKGDLQQLQVKLLENKSLIKSTDETSRTVLHWAASGGQTTVVQWLIEHQAEIDARDDTRWTPLIIASSAGKEAVVRLLIGAGADVDACTDQGRSSLLYACSRNRQSIAKLLLQDRVDPNLQDKLGATPLHRAAGCGHIEIVRLLLSSANELDVNAADNYGNTGLHYACEEGHVEVCRLLLEAGVKLDLTNREGLTPAQENPNDIAKLLNHPKASQLLGAMFGGMGGPMSGMMGEDDDELMRETQTNTTKPAETQPQKPDPRAGLSESQRQAEAEKDLGNEAYKKKDFAKALIHYEKAIELEPSNITYQTNKAAVYFEQNVLDKCIEVCEKAIETGRENKADYTLIAKAYARIGNAYAKMKDLKKALKYYDHSLSEHRNPEVLKKKQQLEKDIKESEALEYINPEEGEKEKNLGNEAFKKGDFPNAMRHYNEAIRRNPKDAKLFRNRALCYSKLMEFQLALKDCDESIKIDPTFVKAYVQKGNILVVLKEPARAMSAYSKAIELEPDCQEAIDGYRQCAVESSSNPEEVRKRAMHDPEVQEILRDPAMRMILEQMQTDRYAVQDHLKNPEIRAKIQKLIESGLIQVR